MEYYAPYEAFTRAATEIHFVDCAPAPDAYLLPPYQATVDAFLTRSSLLSPPPIHMRGYGMPEYLWYWFENWFAAPADMRELLLYHAAVGFRMRWPWSPVDIRTKEQRAWIKAHPPGEPSTFVQRMNDLFHRWEGERRAHLASLFQSSATPFTFYRFRSEGDPIDASPVMSAAGSPFGSPHVAAFSLGTPLSSPLLPSASTHASPGSSNLIVPLWGMNQFLNACTPAMVR